MRPCNNIWKITTAQEDDHITCCLLGYNLFFFYNSTYKWLTIASKKLTKENKIIQSVKPKTNRQPTLTSDKYAYGEVLHIIADISNTTFRNSHNLWRD